MTLFALTPLASLVLGQQLVTWTESSAWGAQHIEHFGHYFILISTHKNGSFAHKLSKNASD